MTFLIGTDEAGYGPNLGPLTITATAWQLPAETSPEQFRDLLQDCISQSACHNSDLIQVADSKQVYSSGRSIAPLEKSVLTLLSQLHQLPADLQQLGNCVSDSFVSAYRNCPVRCETPPELPLATPVEAIEASSHLLQKTLAATQTQLVEIRSCVMFPAEFNELVAASGSKGRVLSTATLQLVADLIRKHQPEDALIVCDKHGGRNRYDDVISTAFDDGLVFRLEEGRSISRYRLDQMEFRFQTKAEEHLPVAAASLVSKYLREVAMLDFNDFWQQKIPGLKATKGYPVDAARFLEDIQEELQATEIDHRSVWRER